MSQDNKGLASPSDRALSPSATEPVPVSAPVGVTIADAAVIAEALRLNAANHELLAALEAVHDAYGWDDAGLTYEPVNPIRPLTAQEMNAVHTAIQKARGQ